MTLREAHRRIRDVFWTVEEASDVLDITERAVYLRIQNGTIETVKIGFRVYIPAHEILRYFAEALDNPNTRRATCRILNDHAVKFGKTPFDFSCLDAREDYGVWGAPVEPQAETANEPTPISEPALYAHLANDEGSDEPFADLAMAVRGLLG